VANIITIPFESGQFASVGTQRTVVYVPGGTEVQHCKFQP